MKHCYTVYAKNLYALAATLVFLRIPFEFSPHKMYGDSRLKSPSRKSTIYLEIDENYIHLDDVLMHMREKYGSNFDFEIISEFNV